MPDFGLIVALAGKGHAKIPTRNGVMKRFPRTLRGFKRDVGGVEEL
jgi:hypothetical protein